MHSSAFLATFAIAALLPGFGLAQDHSWGLSARAINRILEQGTWGPTLTPPASLQHGGFDAWFAEQVNAPVSSYADQPMLDSAGKNNKNLQPVQAAFFGNALNGPDQLRQRVALIFADNGSGARGDMRSVVYAILVDPEARAGDDAMVADAPGYGHMREPILFVLNLLRGLGGSVSSTSNVSRYAGQLGQTLFYAPSVFSFFSPQYRTPDGSPAPEFQIYSTQSAVNRANLVNSAVYTGRFDGGTTFNLAPYVTAASSQNPLTELINTVFFHEDMSDNVKNAINQATGAVTLPSDKAKAALYIALTSGEYQIIR